MQENNITSSDKNQEYKKKIEELKKQGIRIFTYEKVSNPRVKKFHMVYKKVFPQPKNELEKGLIRSCAEDNPKIRFETWDMSRRDEVPYIRKSYMLVSETDNKEEIDCLVEGIIDIEKKYSNKKEEFEKKVIYSISD